MPYLRNGIRLQKLSIALESQDIAVDSISDNENIFAIALSIGFAAINGTVKSAV